MKDKLLKFITIQKRTYASINKRFGYKKNIGKLIKELIEENKIEATQEFRRIGGTTYIFKIKKESK